MRAVLITVADAANRDGAHAYPGIESMVEGSLYSRAHVLSTLKRLIEDGWLEVEQEGRGRGHSTVYKVVMEKVQPVDLLLDPSEEKRSNPDPEKVQSGDSSPYYPTVKSSTVSQRHGPTTTTDAPDDTKGAIKDQARTIASHVWDNRRPRPATPYIGAARIAESLIAAGHAPEAVLDAMMSAPTISIRALEVHLAGGFKRAPDRNERTSDAIDSVFGQLGNGGDSLALG